MKFGLPNVPGSFLRDVDCDAVNKGWTLKSEHHLVKEPHVVRHQDFIFLTGNERSEELGILGNF